MTSHLLQSDVGSFGRRMPLQVHAVFESILDWDTFSVRISQAQLANLPQVLLSVTPDHLARMQRRLTQVGGHAWHHGVQGVFSRVGRPGVVVWVRTGVCVHDAPECWLCQIIRCLAAEPGHAMLGRAHAGLAPLHVHARGDDHERSQGSDEVSDGELVEVSEMKSACIKEDPGWHISCQLNPSQVACHYQGLPYPPSRCTRSSSGNVVSKYLLIPYAFFTVMLAVQAAPQWGAHQ